MSVNNNVKCFSKSNYTPIWLLYALPFFSKIYCRCFPLSEKNCVYAKRRTSIDFEIISIAFNNVQLITLQISLFKRYCHKNIALVIADNSTEKTIRKKIRNLCIASNISYIAIPGLWLSPRHNLSHGLAMNWVYFNYLVKKQSLKYFGFIDQDLFPIRKIENIRKILDKQSAYGVIISFGNVWFLWPGLCFFSVDYLKTRCVDFQVSIKRYSKTQNIVMDTGSAHSNVLYTNEFLSKQKYWLAHKYLSLQKNCQDSKKIKMLETIEIFGDYAWLHLIGTGQIISPEKKLLLRKITRENSFKLFQNGQDHSRITYFALFPRKALFMHVDWQRR